MSLGLTCEMNVQLSLVYQDIHDHIANLGFEVERQIVVAKKRKRAAALFHFLRMHTTRCRQICRLHNMSLSSLKVAS